MDTFDEYRQMHQIIKKNKKAIYIKEDKEYQKHLDREMGIIHTKYGKISINKVAFGVCATAAAHSAVNLAAIVVRPDYSLVSFEGLVYVAMGGLSIKLGYGRFKKVREQKLKEIADRVK